jgi:hypothetical protein
MRGRLLLLHLAYQVLKMDVSRDASKQMATFCLYSLLYNKLIIKRRIKMDKINIYEKLNLFNEHGVQKF